jgi:hypothetical protein
LQPPNNANMRRYSLAPCPTLPLEGVTSVQMTHSMVWGPGVLQFLSFCGHVDPASPPGQALAAWDRSGPDVPTPGEAPSGARVHFNLWNNGGGGPAQTVVALVNNFLFRAPNTLAPLPLPQTPADPVPAPADPVPAPADPVPAPADPVPAPADPVPAPADPLPAPADPVPAPADPVPAPADPVPAPADPVPAPPAEPPAAPAPADPFPVAPPPQAAPPNTGAEVDPEVQAVIDAILRLNKGGRRALLSAGPGAALSLSEFSLCLLLSLAFAAGVVCATLGSRAWLCAPEGPAKLPLAAKATLDIPSTSPATSRKKAPDTDHWSVSPLSSTLSFPSTLAPPSPMTSPLPPQA